MDLTNLGVIEPGSLLHIKGMFSQAELADLRQRIVEKIGHDDFLILCTREADVALLSMADRDELIAALNEQAAAVG